VESVLAGEDQHQVALLDVPLAQLAPLLLRVAVGVYRVR
jgi:hypothetical protein